MHRIKNTAGDIGAARLHALAAGLERTQAQQPGALPDLVPLGPALAEALAALDHLQNEETRR